MQEFSSSISVDNTVGLDNCKSDPVPGAIQPHGVLLALDPDSGVIMQISENCQEHLHLPAAYLLGKSIEAFMTAESNGHLRAALQSDDLRKTNPISLSFHIGENQKFFDGIVHLSNDLVILELEPRTHQQPIDFPSHYHNVRESILSLQNTRTIDEACASVVTQVRRLCGFDRVVLYTFDREWNGHVIAECRATTMEGYLHQRFPATDMPEQDRRLYALNWVRLIVDINYCASRIVPDNNPRTGRPLDLSRSTLSGVSNEHLEYLRHMPVQSSMSISVMKEDRLWGLIHCHHPQPRFVSYEVRSACELLGQIFSYHLTTLESREEIKRRQELRGIVNHIEKQIRDCDDIHEAFIENGDAILRLTQASGAALIVQKKITMFGTTPDREAIFDIVRQLRSRAGRDVFSSQKLADLLPNWGIQNPGIAGILAIKLSDAFDSYIIWFRPELIQTIHWTGHPAKPSDPNQLLSPHGDFEHWQEQVSGQSIPFEAVTIEAAMELRNLILLKQLSKLNADLRLSNHELDEFAQIISHDLREPLRGIRSYAQFILEDEGRALSEKTQDRLASIMGLSRHMDGLTTSLFHYARLGRYNTAMMQSDLNEVVEGVLFRLRSLIEEEHVEIIRLRKLPRISCSPVRVGEIFYNLISNGIKYNKSSAKKIIISCMNKNEAGEAIPVFMVQDNGIGIDPQFHETVFRIFRRLHSQSEYGGGTGAGLAIVKKLVESHHGRIWIDSTPGEGSTFYFTLQADS